MKRFLLFLFFFFYAKSASAGFVVDHTHTDLSDIPDEWITAVKQNLHGAYNHTSHGSQLITGMNALEAYPDFANKYDWTDNSQGDSASLSLDDRGIAGMPDLSQGDVDSDSDGIADWAEDTYTYLDNSSNNHVNFIMWSWCNIAGHDITMYLNSMEWLIGHFSEGGTHARASSYPVQFVFMTAHANGGGEGDSSDIPNEQIRNHVATFDRILFDFSDIENYDPDENYYLDKLLNDALYYDTNGDYSRDANWASEYLIRHDDSELDRLTTGDNVSGYSGAGSCAHSDGPDNDARLNCVLKGRAAWYLYARLAGWDGNSGPEVTCSDYDGNQSSCEANSCTYCSANSSCGTSECCGDSPGSCSGQSACESASHIWCSSGNSCGSSECCGDDASICQNQSSCESASHIWCSSDSSCNTSECCGDDASICQNQSSCESASHIWCSSSSSCGAEECCGDAAGQCSNQSSCENASYYWCDSSCQDSACPVLRADVDGDTNTDSSDALLILRKALDRSMSGTDWQDSATTGDVNCDTEVNTLDALLTLRYSLSLDMTGSGWCG